MNRNIYAIILFMILGVLCMRADELDEAAQAYNSGDYAKAIELYKKIEKKEGTSSALCFNMGQAYTRANNLGQAMLMYQRAIKLNPSNAEARSNIKYVESKVQDANRTELKNKKLSVIEDEPSFFGSVRNYITKRHLSNTWAIWAASCFILMIGCFALYIFSSQVLVRKIGFFGGGAMILLCASFITFAFMAANSVNKKERGVITEYKVELKSEPSTSSKSVAAPLTQGTMMNIINNQKDENDNVLWYKVRLNSDYVGWVSAENFQAI